MNRARSLLKRGQQPKAKRGSSNVNTESLSALLAEGGTRPEWDVILTAAQKNKPREVWRLMAQEGIPASHANVVGQTALHIAALWGSVESMGVLIQAGADINAKNRIAGSTPLICAVKGTFQTFKETHPRRRECLRMLLEAGADASVADNRGRDAYKACDDAIREAGLRGVFGIEDEMEEMRAVLESMGFRAPKKSALLQYIERNDARGVRACLDYEDVDAADLKKGLLAAVTKFEALIDERSDAVDELRPLKYIIFCLLEADADPNVQPSDASDPPSLKEAPLHRICASLCAAYHPSSEPAAVDLAHDVVIALVEKDAKVGPKTRALLPNAALRGDIKSVKLLIKTVGVDVNFRGRQGMTALILASRGGKVDVVRLLLEDDSVDVVAADDRGKKAVDYATANGKVEIVEMLLEQGMSKGLLDAVEKFQALVDKRSIDFFELKLLADSIHHLLGDSADPNVQPPDASDPPSLKEAPLHMICSSLCATYHPSSESAAVDFAHDIVRSLVERGAKVGSKTMALLPNAALRGDVRSVELLIKTVGVDPNFRGRQGMTGLILASRGGKIDVVRMLLGAESIDVNAADDRGKRAVDYAKANGKATIVELLT